MGIVIIGNGIAGNSAAETIRRFDRESRIVIVSEEEEPLYSACALPDYVGGEIERERLFLKSAQDYRDQGIELMLGTRAVGVDTEAKALVLESATLPYDKLIIATGSEPLVPPISGVTKEGVFALKSLKDVEGILNYKGKTAAVIGAGPIGVEAAIALRRAGYRVYLIELCDWILPRLFDKRPASFLGRYLNRRGVEVFTGERVFEISGEDQVAGVRTDRRELQCDLVLLALGMRPDVEVAQGAGLALGALGGIKVDKAMKTNVPDVYACGDCVETRDVVTGKRILSQLWPSAQQQGTVAGYNCAGDGKLYPGSVAMVGLDIFGIHAVSFGLTEAGISDKHEVEVVEERFHNGYCRLVACDGCVVGLQAVGMTRGVGVFLQAIRQHTKLKEIEKNITPELLAGQPLWRYKLSPGSSSRSRASEGSPARAPSADTAS